VVAVHCKEGLGRTGTLIALYMMRSCGFSAREAMGWLRIMRPGSVIGRQQRYVCQVERAVLTSCSGSRLRKTLDQALKYALVVDPIRGKLCSKTDDGRGERAEMDRSDQAAHTNQAFLSLLRTKIPPAARKDKPAPSPTNAALTHSFRKPRAGQEPRCQSAGMPTLPSRLGAKGGGTASVRRGEQARKAPAGGAAG
jgi:hypothetical protein